VRTEALGLSIIIQNVLSPCGELVITVLGTWEGDPRRQYSTVEYMFRLINISTFILLKKNIIIFRKVKTNDVFLKVFVI
jgi:hypothetical protein